jgi:GxxExxY protein
MKHEELTEQIIQAFYKVYNTLGYGFLEKVYENAMVVELTLLGLKVEKQKSIVVNYFGHIVGEYFSDLIIEETVLCELKASPSVIKEHEVQLLNYLRATDIEIGLLLNFGKQPEFRRKIYDNDKKSWRTTRGKFL